MTYTTDNNILTVNTDIGYLRKYSELNTSETISGWKKVTTLSDQPVIRQYVFDNTTTGFEIDVYNNSGFLNDLWVRVYLNNKLQFENGKPVRLYAYIDQTGFSISKWTLKLNCRDYDYTAEEKLVAKKFIPNSNLLKGTKNDSKYPPYFQELIEKIEKLENTENKKTIERTIESMKKKTN